MKEIKTIGKAGERAAAKFLRRNRYRILERNFRYGRLELDIIAANRREIAFVEVKTSVLRDENSRPAFMVDRDKMKNTVAAAKGYLSTHTNRRQPRFDVIEVYVDDNSAKPRILRINHIENAFTLNNI